MTRIAPPARSIAIRFILSTAFVAAIAALLIAFACPGSSHADELDDAWADLSAKTAEIEGLTEQMEQARANVDVCQHELESITGSIIESQANLASVQARFSAVSRLLYKTDDLSIWQIVSSSNSIDELLNRISQLEAIGTQAVNLAEEEKRAQEALAGDYEEVSKRKDEAQEAEVQLAQTKEALEASASSLEQRIAELEEEKALAEAAAQAAAALKAAEEAARQAANSQDTTIYNAAVDAEGASDVPVREEASEEEQAARAEQAGVEWVEEAQVQEPVVQEAAAQDAGVQEEQPQTGAETYATTDTTGWSTGIASAYGGSSDPNTPNPGTTATGAVCDDYSVGVAVPLAWGPAAYYGRMVEISYGGMTVVATVNDCGGMGGGSRSLDLQPGVFKAFGFSTCQEWGLREVQYRFL